MWLKRVFSENKTFDQHFGANLIKYVFCKILQLILYFFTFFLLLAQKNWKGRFQPLLGLRSTQTLVEIYNKKSLREESTVIADLVNLSPDCTSFYLLLQKYLYFVDIKLIFWIFYDKRSCSGFWSCNRLLGGLVKERVQSSNLKRW